MPAQVANFQQRPFLLSSPKGVELLGNGWNFKGKAPVKGHFRPLNGLVGSTLSRVITQLQVVAKSHPPPGRSPSGSVT